MTYYTVKQVADMAGVTARMLHHYDRIGLLKPAAVGENGYRQYGRAELLRLQQILFHKALGLKLAEIGRVLDDPAFDARAALESHKQQLEGEQNRLKDMIKTIDNTLATQSSNTPLKDTELYGGLSENQQSDYEHWLIEHYGADMPKRIAHSKKAFSAMSKQDRDGVVAELEEIEQCLAEGLRQEEPAESSAHDLLLDRHRAWVAFMWDRPCPHDAYAGLADLYLSHPDFEKRYEQIEAGFTAYLTDAMKAYAGRHI